MLKRFAVLKPVQFPPPVPEAILNKFMSSIAVAGVGLSCVVPTHRLGKAFGEAWVREGGTKRDDPVKISPRQEVGV